MQQYDSNSLFVVLVAVMLNATSYMLTSTTEHCRLASLL